MMNSALLLNQLAYTKTQRIMNGKFKYFHHNIYTFQERSSVRDGLFWERILLSNNRKGILCNSIKNYVTGEEMLVTCHILIASLCLPALPQCQCYKSDSLEPIFSPLRQFPEQKDPWFLMNKQNSSCKVVYFSISSSNSM